MTTSDYIYFYIIARKSRNRLSINQIIAYLHGALQVLTEKCYTFLTQFSYVRQFSAKLSIEFLSLYLQ